MKQMTFGLMVTALAGAWMLSSGLSAHAQSTPTPSGSWQVNAVYPNTDGTGSVLWIKPGATDGAGNYSGDTASVWRLDSSGKETAIGPSYGPFPGWYAVDIVPVANGTTRLRWAKQEDSSNPGNDTTVSIWTMDATGKEIATGPAYGPFTGWANEDFGVAPDGTTRLGWVNHDTTGTSGDEISGWTLDATGKKIAQGPVYGPFAGWTENETDIAPDSTVRGQLGQKRRL